MPNLLAIPLALLGVCSSVAAATAPGAGPLDERLERLDLPALRRVSRGEEPDVDDYDACYLPDGRIVFASSRVFQGIPCVGGKAQRAPTLTGDHCSGVQELPPESKVLFTQPWTHRTFEQVGRLQRIRLEVEQ